MKNDKKDLIARLDVAVELAEQLHQLAKQFFPMSENTQPTKGEKNEK